MKKELIILYVDDEPDIRDVIEFALEDEGFLLKSYPSGENAIGNASDIDADLILLDVMMPGMDGPTTLEGLRRFSHLNDVPVIFMTAKVQPTEIDQLLSLGAAGVISKPFDPMSLANDIKTILSKV